MKKILFYIAIAVWVVPVSTAWAQEVEARLNEAQSAYQEGKLDAARFALQQAMNEVDLAIGREVLMLLPEKLGEMPVVSAEDQVASASMGFAGLFVQRKYRLGEKADAELQILADSPLLTGINAILALPSFASDPNQKRIRVANYRALLQRSEDSSNLVSWDIQLPFGSSLLSLTIKGVDNENAVIEMANTIPIEQVARLIQ